MTHRTHRISHPTRIEPSAASPPRSDHPHPVELTREVLVERALQRREPWDLIVIGGGATGLGTALDAASRGYSAMLLEASDFAKGTSSRSTKLAHGGVRYLQQGDIRLVREALHERGIMRRNAPHLVHDQAFVIPAHSLFEKWFYGIGLKIYDLLSGRLSYGRSRVLGRDDVRRRLPTVDPSRLNGGVLYHDGQFDDARLAVDMALAVVREGGVPLNHMPVRGILHERGRVVGVKAEDLETGLTHEIRARAVVNATGVFADQVMSMDRAEHRTTIRPSQGTHIVLDREFLPGDDALMIPKTPDGRVLFAVPWHGKVLVGTTDELVEEPEFEPRPMEREVDFILETAASVLTRTPTRGDIRSVFSGLRPLAAPRDPSEPTKEISRSHKIVVASSGLITMTGGKWTTYRKMAQDLVDEAVRVADLAPRACVTEWLPIQSETTPDPSPVAELLRVYGSWLPDIEALERAHPHLSRLLHPDYPYRAVHVVWAVRQELARTLEDVLARRLRLLFLDARAALQVAPDVAALMASELHSGEEWAILQVERFEKLAKGYLPSDPAPSRPSNRQLSNGQALEVSTAPRTLP